MSKKYILFILGLLILVPSVVYAHTGLKEASPGINETMQGKVNRVELIFATKIEQGSSFSIQGSDQKKIPINQIVVEGEMMTGTIQTPLSDDKYKVQWKIIGADGHPIEGQYSFEVKNSAGKKLEQQTEIKKEKPKLNESKPSQQKSTSTPTQSSTPIYWIVALLIIGTLVSFWLLWRRKAK